MYSVVLLMALSGGAETPALGHGCHGCNGCSGCHVASCHGCHGCHGCHKSRGCHGCHGCHGLFSCHGCHGCHGCSSSCGGYGCSSSHGGYVCSGNCGGYVCGGAPAYVAPAAEMPAPGKKQEKKEEKKKDKEEANVPSPATIVVTLPADAKLMIDDTATTSTSATRVFVSPSLNPGQEYHYQLTAELNRDGQKVTTTKQVAVRAGVETRVQIEFPLSSVASN